MNTPYSELRGKAYVLGYVDEDGNKTPVRMFPAETMNLFQLAEQISHIQKEFCNEDLFRGKRGHHRVEKADGTKEVHHDVTAKEALKRGGKGSKIVKSWFTQSGEETHDDDFPGLKEEAESVDEASLGYSGKFKNDWKDSKKLYKKAAEDKDNGPDAQRQRRWARVLANRSGKGYDKSFKTWDKIDRKVENTKDLGETAGGLEPGKKANKKYSDYLAKQKAARDANKKAAAAEYAKKNLKEQNEEEENHLHNAIHSFPLPPTREHESHFNYVHRVDPHFKAHLALHGHDNKFTNKERQTILAHKHLESRGHIKASLHDVAHGDKKEHIEHARKVITGALYGPNDDEPEHKIAKVFAHKALKKVYPDPEPIPAPKPAPPHPRFSRFEE